MDAANAAPAELLIHLRVKLSTVSSRLSLGRAGCLFGLATEHKDSKRNRPRLVHAEAGPDGGERVVRSEKEKEKRGKPETNGLILNYAPELHMCAANPEI